MKELNIFNEQQEVPMFESIKPFQAGTRTRSIKALLGYRTSTNPKEKCKFCVHRISYKYSKTYHKCRWIGLTSYAGTDIRLKNVCNKFKHNTK